MRDRPILMNGAMIRATLDGSKTQTRRIVTGHPGGEWTNDGFGRITSKHPKQGRFGLFIRRGVGTDFPECDLVPCPYGQPGDRLWVRESGIIHKRVGMFRHDVPATPKIGHYWIENTRGIGASYMVDGCSRSATLCGDGWKVCPSIHMPRWASRILLEITAVRVERLQDISEADAEAEGCRNSLHLTGGRFAKENFEHLWWTINGDGSWEANPWVWVVEFKRVKP